MVADGRRKGKRMKIVVDTSLSNLVVEDDNRVAEIPLFSTEAFDLISKLWLRVGWNRKYSYAFSWLGHPITRRYDPDSGDYLPAQAGRDSRNRYCTWRFADLLRQFAQADRERKSCRHRCRDTSPQPPRNRGSRARSDDYLD